MTKLNLEQFQDRINPSAAFQYANQLIVTGDTLSDNVITLDPAANGTDLRLTLNGVQTTYTGVTDVRVFGGIRNDDVSNNTSTNITAFLFAGDDTFIAGTGTNTVYGGAGKDVLYALTGQSTVVSNDDGNDADRVYVSATAKVFTDNKDQLVTFFANGRTPGSGIVQLDSNVLYITPLNNGSITTIEQVGNLVLVTYDFGNGPQFAVFNKQDVKVIAYFGGTGNDLYVNNTNIEEAAYGSAGNDTIVGGFGAFNLLKGSGGNDTLIARGNRADVSANGGIDTITVQQQTKATVRTNANTTLIGIDQNDLVVPS